MAAGYEVSRALIVRSTMAAPWHPVFADISSDSDRDTQLPIITVEYSDAFFPDVDHMKFHVGWPARDSIPPNVVILRHEREGWYLKDALLTDSNWSAQVNSSIRADQINYLILAIHPKDVFGDAVRAAGKCKAMHTVGTVVGIVMFQCNYD